MRIFKTSRTWRALGPTSSEPTKQISADAWFVGPARRILATSTPMQRALREPGAYVPPSEQAARVFEAGIKTHVATWGHLRLSTLQSDRGTYLMCSSHVRGNSAKVHRGIAPDGSPVSVKLLRLIPKRMSRVDLSTVSEILREVALQEQANAPMRPRDVLWLGDRVAIIAPLMDGDVFQLAKATHGVLPRGAINSAILDVAAQLAEGERQGVSHLGIKTENLLWSRDGHFALTDFGRARRTADLLIDGSFVGKVPTASFAAPEAVFERSNTATSDTFSLGMLILALHLGEPYPECLNVDSTGPRADSQRQFAYGNFQLWRAGLLRPQRFYERHPKVMLERIGINASEFDREFAILSRANPRLCRYVIGHMLNPDARARPTSGEACAMLQRLVQRPKEPWYPQAPEAHEMPEQTDAALAALRGYRALSGTYGAP